MVRRLILAAAVSLCVSNHCAADAVRRIHVVDPAEAKKQEQQAQLKELQAKVQRLQKSSELFKQTADLIKERAEIRLEKFREKDQDVRAQLQLQIDGLDRQIQQLQAARKALLK